MAALLVAMSVIAVALSTALPVFQTVARREREAELVFRGEQYARAIGLFQRKYGNSLPPDVDVLIRERFLRKKYKDPITGDDFQLLGPNSPELAEAMNTPPVGAQGRGGEPFGRGGERGRGGSTGSRGESGRGAQQSGFRNAARQTQMSLGQLARQTADGGAPGGILAVASKSKQTSFRVYNGKDKYNEWVFMALQASVAGGAPAGSGGQTPGVRGGAAPGGRRGTAPPSRGLGPGGRFGRGRGL